MAKKSKKKKPVRVEEPSEDEFEPKVPVQFLMLGLLVGTSAGILLGVKINSVPLGTFLGASLGMTLGIIGDQIKKRWDEYKARKANRRE